MTNLKKCAQLLALLKKCAGLKLEKEHLRQSLENNTVRRKGTISCQGAASNLPNQIFGGDNTG